MRTLTSTAEFPERGAAVRLTNRLALAIAVLTFALMVLGATVRGMDAGLACPDWPLCHGQYLPPFEPVLWQGTDVPTPGQMNAEWLHRLVASLVGLLSLGLAGAVWRTGDRRLRRWAALAAALLVIQIGLGAATVFLNNVPYSVALHLGVATAFLTTLSWIYRLSRAAPSALPGTRGLRLGLAVTAGLVFAQMMLGALIAKTPGADLVCPTFPHCGRDDYYAVGHLVGMQMTHRVLGFLILFAILWGAGAARGAARAWGLAGLGLIVAQIAVGTLNVIWRVPVAVTAAHLGLAVLIFLLSFHWSAGIRPEPSPSRNS